MCESQRIENSVSEKEDAQRECVRASGLRTLSVAEEEDGQRECWRLRTVSEEAQRVHCGVRNSETWWRVHVVFDEVDVCLVLLPSLISDHLGHANAKL